MKIETVQTTKKIEVEKTIAKYSQKEIEDLIRKDLEAHGYKVENISVLTETKYVVDEWGMNRRLTTYLKGIEAVVTPSDLKK
jgi:hypothetical protein